jgi:hypothetical protein
MSLFILYRRVQTLQEVTNNVSATVLPEMSLPDACIQSETQVEALNSWRYEFGQSVPQKTVRSMTIKDNPGTLPVVMYQRPDVPV